MVDCVVGPVHFSSSFDSGNLAAVSLTDQLPSDDTPCSSNDSTPAKLPSVLRRGVTSARRTDAPATNDYFLWIAPDCQGTSHENSHRSWFYFSASWVGPPEMPAPAGRGAKRSTNEAAAFKCSFTIVNLSAANRIFDYDNRPVYRVDGDSNWNRLPKPLDIQLVDSDGAVTPLPDASMAITGAASVGVARSTNVQPAGSFARRVSKKLQNGKMRITWTFTFTPGCDTVYFAMCYPYSYRQQMAAIERWYNMAAASRPLQPHPPTSPAAKPSPTTPASPASASGNKYPSELSTPDEIVFVRETLAFTLQNRAVDLLTISNTYGMVDEDEPHYSRVAPVRNGAKRPKIFPEKQLVLLTARVHPGETPASHVMHGLVEFLLHPTDPRAQALRRHFVFKVVPMLNPDGVVMGHYRTDSRGVNLNRCYDNPSVDFHPVISAVRDLFRALAGTGRLALYVDLHAHASKRGCFVFANAWDSEEAQVANMLFPKLMSINSMHVDFPSCDFTSRSMTAKSKSDGVTKEGTGRVALAVDARLVHSYTFEVSYNMGLSANPIVALDLPGEAGSASRSLKYTPEVYFEVGRSVAVSLLDMQQLNPVSRLPHTPFLSAAGVRSWLVQQMKQFYDSEQRAVVLAQSSYGTTAKSRNARKARETLSAKLALPTLNASRARGLRLTHDGE